MTQTLLENDALLAQRVAVKFFIASPASIEPESFVPVLHKWIQTHAIADHLLIDVADYKHVVAGPGVVLISHHANIHIDMTDHRAGLLYIRKQMLNGSFSERLKQIFRSALDACAKLEAEADLPKIQFRTDELLFRINDRLLAPNDEQTFDAVKPQLTGFLQELYKAAPTLSQNTDALSAFEVQVKLPQSVPVTELLSRLG